MKIAGFAHASGTGWGFVEGGNIIRAGDGVQLLAALADRPLMRAARAAAGVSISLDTVRLLAPIPNPPQFIGVGMNYRAHAAEAGMDIPTSPVTFPFHNSAIIGPDASIEIPAISEKIDWEVELAIVIGSGEETFH